MADPTSTGASPSPETIEGIVDLALMRAVWAECSRKAQLTFMLEIIEQFFKADLPNG